MLLTVLLRSAAGGSPWTGDMHPSIGFNAGCDLGDVPGACAPTYDNLRDGGALWDCPDGERQSNSTWPACEAAKKPIIGNNPLCFDLTASNPCCCPDTGCFAEPRFNTIIGVCRNQSCACGNRRTLQKSCAPQGRPDQCGAPDCTGEPIVCCSGVDVRSLVPYYDLGSKAQINYWAAYEFDPADNQWHIQEESSFNTDGSRPTFDLTEPFGGLDPSEAWLGPQPGGSVFWGLGYYPAGVKGVGENAAMFVLSTEHFFGATWYMLNQLTLDRGPATPYSSSTATCPVSSNNCWAAGNGGEMDFLESPWNRKDGDVDGYRRSFSSQNNQMGRQFNGGVNTGGFHTNNYLLTADVNTPEPIVYVAVVDKIGNWVYRIPASEVESIWPGLARTTAEATVAARPTQTPTSVNPCRDGFCAIFTSNCQATTWEDALAQNCGFNQNQGFCGNWFNRMVDTQQPLFPSAACQRDVRSGVTMPWCIEMVNNTPSAEVFV